MRSTLHVLVLLFLGVALFLLPAAGPQMLIVVSFQLGLGLIMLADAMFFTREAKENAEKMNKRLEQMDQRLTYLASITQMDRDQRMLEAMHRIESHLAFLAQSESVKNEIVNESPRT